MKTETILNTLLKFKQNQDEALIDNLINELKIDVKSNTKDFSSNKIKAEKKALKMLAKIKKKNIRPALSYAHVVKGIQYFTDSYIAFALKTHFELPLIENSDTDLRYPDIARLFPAIENGQKVDNAKAALEDILKDLKAKNLELSDDKIYLASLHSKDYTTWFDANYLKTICTILETTDLDVYLYGELKTALFINNETGNMAAVCPIRKYN